ncbi:hypothetical protein ACJJTC_013644 [Scirpophaga incertulas]
MRGIGDNIVIPLGSACIDIEIQNIIEKVNVFIVGDSVIKYPVLIGHSFTEKPGIVITKTTDSLIFKRHCTGKQLLVCRESITIEPGQMSIVSVSSENDYSGFIYVRGSLRRIDGDDYYLMAGEYSIKNGNGCILVQNLINKSIFIAKDTLWTRAIDSSRDCLNVNVLDMSSLDSDLNYWKIKKKLLPKFHGSYRILKILPNDRFLVEDTPLSRRGSKRYENIVALDKMHPWLSFKNHSTDDSGTDNDDDIPEE